MYLVWASVLEKIPRRGAPGHTMYSYVFHNGARMDRCMNVDAMLLYVEGTRRGVEL